MNDRSEKAEAVAIKKCNTTGTFAEELRSAQEKFKR